MQDLAVAPKGHPQLCSAPEGKLHPARPARPARGGIRGHRLMGSTGEQRRLLRRQKCEQGVLAACPPRISRQMDIPRHIIRGGGVGEAPGQRPLAEGRERGLGRVGTHGEEALHHLVVFEMFRLQQAAVCHSACEHACIQVWTHMTESELAR